MARRQPDGQSLAQHLKAAARRSAAAKAKLIGPPCPAAAEHIWGWFRALDAGRGGNGFGPNPLAWAELESFARVQGLRFTPFELELLRGLDHAWLTAQAKAQEKKP